MFLPDPNQAALLSIKVGIWCAVIGCPVAISLGWLLARHSFPGKSALGTLVLAPVVLPPVVTGLLLLKFFKSSGPVGTLLENFGISIPFTFAGVFLAALVVGLPLYVMSVRNAFDAVDRKYEELSFTLGHSKMRTFLKVSLPLAIPGILAGALLAFARALGEFGATAVLAGNIEGKTRTLSLAIYSVLEGVNGEAALYRLLWISLAMAFGALVVYDMASRWQRRRLEGGHAG
jgi:molybdate transport system permease protein